jgi:DNA polymerase III alpha subunit (gram-positive type)
MVELKGITDAADKKRITADSLAAFFDFIENDAVVSHNVRFDFDFISAACSKCGMNIPCNDRVDILQLSKKLLYNLKGHSISSLVEHFHICVVEDVGRSISDCYAMMDIYEKLRTMS